MTNHRKIRKRVDIIYKIEYKDFHELLNTIKVIYGRNRPIKKLKYHTDFDVIIVYNRNEFVAAFTQDTEFADTISNSKYIDCQTYKTNFTKSIRCVIIEYKDYEQEITLEELVARYLTKI